MRQYEVVTRLIAAMKEGNPVAIARSPIVRPLMFVIRTFGSGVSQKSPLGTLIVCSILTFAGLYWLGGLQPGASAVVAFVAATIFGIGKTYFAPTMMGVLSEQLPRGGIVGSGEPMK